MAARRGSKDFTFWYKSKKLSIPFLTLTIITSVYNAACSNIMKKNINNPINENNKLGMHLTNGELENIKILISLNFYHFTKLYSSYVI